MTLSETLAQFHSNVLKALVHKTGAAPATKKQSNIDLLVAKLPAPERIATELNALTQEETLLLAHILDSGGSINTRRLKRLAALGGLASISTTARGGRPREPNLTYRRDPAFEDVYARLLQRGLVLSHTRMPQHGSVLDWTPGRVIFIPDFIVDQLPETLLSALPESPPYEPAAVRTGLARTFQRDVSRYVRFARAQGGLSLTSQSVLYKSDLKALAEALGVDAALGSGRKETDTGYLFFIRRVLTQANLLQYGRDGLTTAGDDHPFFGMDSAERTQYIFEIWRDSTAWNGLRQLTSYDRGYDILNPAPYGLPKSRGIVLDAIRQLGGDWVLLDTLIYELQDNQYGFLFPERTFSGGSYYSYYGRSEGVERTPYYQGNNKFGMGFKGMTDEEDGWDKVEAAYINHIVVGPLFWMGLVELDYANAVPKADYQGVVRARGYRLNAYGRWLLGIGERPAQSDTSGTLIVQPNFDIVAMEPIDLDTIVALDAFADLKDSGTHVSTYHLTKESVYRGQQGKWQASRIIKFLDEATAMPLTDNVRRSLEEWDALHNRIVIRRKLCLIEVASAAVSAEIIRAVPDVRQLDATRLLSPHSFDGTVFHVRNSGYLPLKSRADERIPSNSLRIDDDGRITFIHAVPSIFAASAVKDVSVAVDPAEERGADRRMIPAMVKAHTKAGKTLPALLDRLALLSKNPLSERLITNMKAWANYYGDARQETLILLEFRDMPARDELCSDPALTAYLTPFAGNRPLASVSAENLTTVRALLAERGVTVTDGL